MTSPSSPSESTELASKPERPDFGAHIDVVSGVELSCRYYAPGLTLHDLVMIHDRASKESAPGDHFAGDPGKWPITRGVKAVADAVIDAMLEWQRKQHKGNS